MKISRRQFVAGVAVALAVPVPVIASTPVTQTPKLPLVEIIRQRYVEKKRDSWSWNPDVISFWFLLEPEYEEGVKIALSTFIETNKDKYQKYKICFKLKTGEFVSLRRKHTIGKEPCVDTFYAHCQYVINESSWNSRYDNHVRLELWSDNDNL
jgi:hypothetical protein